MAWELSLENIAGIRHGAATLEPGVNAVRASNWQGKSSFLAGIRTALGTATPLTEGQSRGRVELTTPEETYTVRLERTDGTVSRAGTPYLRDEYDRVCAELFAFLDEDNEIRRAVRRGEDLEPLITRPLDFEDIEERVADLRREREQVSSELERANGAAERLPELQRRVSDLESDLEALRAERAELDATAGDDDARDRLSELRAERSRVETRIERLEGTAERVRETLAEKREELTALSIPDADEAEAELDDLRSDLRDAERDRELLQSVYEANRRVLDEGRLELLTAVSHEMLTDSVTCWVCGEEATRDEVERQLEALDERIGDLETREGRLRERVDELETRRREAREARQRATRLEDRISELESQVAETEERLTAAREEHTSLEAAIEDLEERVDAATDRVTDLESEIRYTETELEDVREELATAESRADRRATLEAEYDSLTEDIADLRERKARVERRAREAFSTALEELLDRFRTGFESARLTSTFDLVVARDGREASLDALSEGERELLGLVAALAGHEAFEVGDRVPVLLLDELGGLSAENLQVLVEYLEGRAEYLVFTAYPEHDGVEANVLSPAEWDVVSADAGSGATS